jgi:hypothetical protein
VHCDPVTGLLRKEKDVTLLWTKKHQLLQTSLHEKPSDIVDSENDAVVGQ